MDEVRVGGEVESYCTTCKIMKYHVVVAVVDGRPAKVECAGCHKQHQFRAAPPGTAAPRPAGGGRPSAAARSRVGDKPAAAPAPAGDDLEARLAAREPRTYAPRERYQIDDVVTHPSFGAGVVIALPAAQKMEVAFRGGGRKLLVHDRGAAVAPALERPQRSEDAPSTIAFTDAPPKV
jgi:hypothetical protein